MGEDKLNFEFEGKSLLQRAVDLLSALPVHRHIIITTDARSKSIVLPPGIKLFVNKDPSAGISGSVKLGVKKARGTHYLFLNADQPRLTVNDVYLLLKIAKANPDKIVFPMINEKPCSPTIFPKSFRKQLLNLSGNNGGSVVRDANEEHIVGAVPENLINFKDVDSMEDYRALF